MPIASRFRTDPPRRPPLPLIGLILALFIAAAPGAVQAAPPEFDKVLAAWIAQNIRFAKDQDSRDTLFTRKASLRVSIRSDIPQLVTETRRTVTNLAAAFGLAHEFTRERPNLVLATLDGTTEAGTPPKQLLAMLGMSRAAVDDVTETSGWWSDGCGIYARRDTSGRLAESIATGDTRQPPATIRACMTTGLIKGFGMGNSSTSLIEFSNDYLQYLLLGRAIAACEKEFDAAGAQQSPPARDVVTTCIVNRMKTRLSN
jgi:hypothetical protein